MKKKYNLGALEVTDRMQMERDEIIIEILDKMQKYVVEVENCARNSSLSLEERYNGVKSFCGRFCGLSDFLNITLDIDIRNPKSGMLYTQEMFNKINYHVSALEIELSKSSRC